MQKRKRNTVIAVIAIALVLVSTGTMVIKTVGFDTIVSWIIPPSRSTQTPPDGQELTLTDPQSDYYDWDGSEFKVDLKNTKFYIKITDVEVTKKPGNLYFPPIQEYADDPPRFLNFTIDSSGNITNDYSYILVSIRIKNLYDEYVTCFTNSEIEYGILGELKDQSDWNKLGWREEKMPTLISITGEIDHTDYLFLRDFAPGETREFTLGYVIDDKDLRKDYMFFYRVIPGSLDSYMYKMLHGLPLPTEPAESGESDTDLRYIYLNKYMEEWLK